MSNATTTYSKGKAFAWSYSKLKNFRTCPKRHFHYEIKKDVREPESDQLLWGNTLHDAFAKYVDKDKPLPETMTQYQPLLDRMKAMPGDTFVEQKYAITKDFGPTEFFARDAWFRSIGDIVKVYGEFAYCGDYKTGKVVEDSEQLSLMAACLFAHFPKVNAVRTEFLWLKDDAITRATFRREEMAVVWNAILPDVRKYEMAVNNTEFPAKPGYLCRSWCSVKSCPYNGK
ncbi:PD-(D/E)XK nuclease superfamily [uncultured Caudovirales phage]|jgi:hypothetical protein|uniref:PD-(D/E)XK nuclease superfamily n=1 Tax=uncultured Caudovirales phage TaxID=2100421 RepID=A0A6J5MHB7_9CAUD|nr:PD-(D/E)XK nuclease superfamily [uncultured Caudovirales phage]